MITTTYCWYLCGLFAVSLVVTSAITVHPDLNYAIGLVMAAEAILSVIFGILAVVSRRTNILGHRWAAAMLICVAVVTTILVLSAIG